MARFVPSSSLFRPEPSNPPPPPPYLFVLAVFPGSHFCEKDQFKRLSATIPTSEADFTMV